MAWTKTISGINRRRVALIVLKEEAVDSSNKVLDYATDIVDGQEMEVLSIRVEYSATATVGTRRIGVQIEDAGGDALRQIEFEKKVTANDVFLYECAVGIPVTDGTDVKYESMPGRFFLRPTDKLRIVDKDVTDVLDDMVVIVTGRLAL